jgi:pimeloyl-ACP methyl ester carboxylesterase
VTSGYVNLGDGKLYYEMKGKGETLVLCHAGFVDSRMWDGQLEDFSQHYRVLRFDMRGFGKSDPARSPVSRRQDLYNLLHELGIEKAHVLGCSMGGEIAIDFTLEHPEMVSSLIIVSGIPGGFEMQGEPPSQVIEMLQSLEQGNLERVSELQIQLWVDGIYRQPEQVDPRVRKMAAEMNLAEIKVPVLVLAGSLDHPEVLRAADVLAKEIKNAKKVILKDSAHVPNMEKPAEFNQIVLDFLRESSRKK